MYKIIFRIIVLLSVILFSLKDIYANSDNEITYKNRYQNMNYLYSIIIPDCLSCIGDPPPSPNHGCNIYLSDNHESYIWITANYNSVNRLSTSEELLCGMDNLVKNGMKITVLQRINFNFSKLQWERLAVSFRKGNNKKTIVEDTAVSFRSVDGYGDIIYTVGLVTYRSRYESDKKIFESILKSWKAENP